MGQDHGKPLVVGIAGGSASGKGRVTQALNEALSKLGVSTTIFHMDAYFRNPLPTCAAPFSEREYPDYNRPDSFYTERLLADVRNSLDARKSDVIIIEGLMVLHDDDLRQSLDLKLYIDADPDERIVRRLRRNMTERGLSFDEIADYYLDSVRFRHNEFVEPSKWHADIIMNGSQWSDTSIGVLVAWIDHKLKETKG